MCGNHALLRTASALAILAAAMCSGTADAQAAPDETVAPGNDIIVTATRSASSISKVPVSIAAVTQEQINRTGVREFADLIRLTPGVNLTSTSSGSNQIAIRGISSAAGASTTGVYIDDVPIQVRSLGYSAGTYFPVLFDLERVEVLRGPQGTLFGSGSQGGTIRFIQPTPSFNDFQFRARAEFGDIDGGGQSYEFGAAVGGPIVDDKIAFRAAGYFRRQGGFVDRIAGTPIVATSGGQPVVDGSLGPDGLRLEGARTVYEDSNWTETIAGRFALAFNVTENLVVTGSFNVEDQTLHDATNTVWVSASRPGRGVYAAPVFAAGSTTQLLNDPNDPGNPATGQPFLTGLEAPLYDKGSDRLYLPYVTVDWSNDAVQLISTTAWLARNHSQWVEATSSYGYSFLGFVAPRVGDSARDILTDRQRNFTQEVRLQSANPDARLRWVVGGFYSNNRQRSYEEDYVNFLGRVPSLFGVTAADGPYPGTSAFLNTFGVPLGPNSLVYSAEFSSRERQLAGFGQVDFKIVPQVTLTVGGRYASNKVRFDTVQGGPLNNLNAPYGTPCPDAAGCTPGQGAFAPVFPIERQFNNEKVFTPKFGISWEPDDRNLIYATASKGFRPGGAQVRVPPVCGGDLTSLGYVDANGNPASPTSYESDTVWNYEVGSKNRMLGGKLRFDGSIYLIKWDKIQTQLQLPTCGYLFVDNLGSAKSRGFDAAVTYSPIPQLDLSASVGYNRTTFSEESLVFQKGDFVPNAGSPWTIYLSGEYRIPMRGNEGYLRSDFTYTSAPRRTGRVDPDSPLFQPFDTPRPSVSLVNLRAGMRFDRVDVSVFVNNALNYNRAQGVEKYVNSPLYTTSYLRPRTVGVTASYRR